MKFAKVNESEIKELYVFCNVQINCESCAFKYRKVEGKCPILSIIGKPLLSD